MQPVSLIVPESWTDERRARTIFWPPGPLPLRKDSSMSDSGGGFGLGGRLLAKRTPDDESGRLRAGATIPLETGLPRTRHAGQRRRGRRIIVPLLHLLVCIVCLSEDARRELSRHWAFTHNVEVLTQMDLMGGLGWRKIAGEAARTLVVGGALGSRGRPLAEPPARK